MSPLPGWPTGCGARGRTSAPAAGGEPGAYRHAAPRRLGRHVRSDTALPVCWFAKRLTCRHQDGKPPMHAGSAPPSSLDRCAAGCQRGRPRFRRAAVNASPGPPHLDTSSPNTHPSSQPTPNRMRAVPADQLPDQDRPRTWWGSGSWPVLRWQRSYPPNCARITSWQRASSHWLSCPPGTWVMGVSFSCLPFSACCHHLGPCLVHWPSCLARSAGLGW